MNFLHFTFIFSEDYVITTRTQKCLNISNIYLQRLFALKRNGGERAMSREWEFVIHLAYNNV